jgi:uncharacterized protein DUF1707
MTSPYRRIRASDAEREEYAELLRAAMTEGRLNLTDGEERLAKAYAATFRDELDPLTTDLPDGGRQALVNTPEFQQQARRQLRGHAGRVAAIAAVLTSIWLLVAVVDDEPTFFWPAIPIAIMLFGLARHRAWQRYRSGSYNRPLAWDDSPAPWNRPGWRER